MKYLFLLTIAPVQTFIEQARKTQDLYAGSQILSELIGKGMEKVKEENQQNEFIFPVNLNQKSKPNRFIAIINSEEPIQQFGAKIKDAINDHFLMTLCQDVIGLYPDCKNQLLDFLKIYWVAQEYDASKPYSKQIKSLEFNLGATKNIRHFQQFEEKGRKCSLNGQFNVKFYRLLDREKKDARLFEKKLFHNDVLVLDSQKDLKILPYKSLQDGEGLSAISLLKRLYKSNEVEFENFPSTAKIALLDTIKKDKLAAKYIEKVKLINNQYVDEQLFYEENLTNKYLKKHGYSKLIDRASNSLVQKFKAEFREMVESVKKEGLILSKYYAILVFDADEMGKQLKKCQSKEEHQCLSRVLGEFAQEAKTYIDNNEYGRTIYAGGDDFMGLVNLNYLFQVMKKLREDFDEIVNKKLKGIDEHGNNFDYSHLALTFSAGIAIAHYKTPLSETLNWARKMGKKAKNVLHDKEDALNKDALSIAVLKRSGEIHDTTWKWRIGDTFSSEILETLMHGFKQKELSKKFIANLDDTFRKTFDEEGDWGADAQQNQLVEGMNAVFNSELERFLLRASSDNFKKQAAVLTNQFYQLYLTHYNDYKLKPQNLLNTFHICEFISRHINPISPTNLEV